ncbi:hypothetical protein BDW74DRAFT_4882 [Aspergillus multicolor]|uniref:uncharacterized protein n=1 Tax=Aspergillus multicolor TaxID=41759 RepID=UPI003CCD86C9
MRLDKVRVKDWGELPSEALKEKRRDDPWDNAFPSPPSSHISLLSSVCRSTKGCTVEQWDRPLINISTLVPGSAFTKEGGVWLDRQIAYDNYGYWNRRHDETRLPFITLEAPLHPKRSDSRDVSRQIILKKNRRQMVTAVNPNVSRETGRHVLDVEAQARHYDLDGKPKGKDGAYTKYRGWYLYEDNIMPDELVGRWMWDDLVKNERWYEDVIMPAFKEHNEKFQASLHGGRHRWSKSLIELGQSTVLIRHYQTQRRPKMR